MADRNKLIQYSTDVTNVRCDREDLSAEVMIRTKLELELKCTSTDRTAFIMMNPSKANNDESDDTVNWIVKLICKKNFARLLWVINLFPIYTPNSDNLYTILQSVNNRQKIMEKNRDSINHIISNVNNIVLAWGNVPTNFSPIVHSKEVLYIYKCIRTHNKRSLYICAKNGGFNLTKFCQPRHPMYFYPNDLISCKINSFNELIPL